MQHDASEINNLLSAKAESVASYLLPNGHKRGNEWCVGSVQGEEGGSLKIVISGPKTGAWKDFAGSDEDRGRKLLGLWCRVRGVPWREAMREAADWLGVEIKSMRAHIPQREYTPVDVAAVRAKACGWGESGAACPRTYERLVQTRNIAPEVLAKYKVAPMRGDVGYVFPFYEGDTIVKVKYKYLDLDEHGKKRILSEVGGKPVLWGMQAVDPNSDCVVITEGEEDAMSYACNLIPAVSVPNGTADTAWIDLCWDWLSGFQRIYLSFDADEPGQELIKKVVDRLGRARCFIVRLPTKDANEYHAGPDQASLKPFIDAAKPLDPDDLREAASYRDEVWKHITNPVRGIGFDYTASWEFRPSELTVVTGSAGSGKSQLTLQVTLELLLRGIPCFIASMEIPTRVTLEKMVRMACAKYYIEKPDLDSAFSLFQNLYLYDKVGAVKWTEIITVLDYARKRFGVGWFVIDSMMRCGIGTDDYELQKAFVDSLATTCTSTGVSGMLVVHPRKSAGASPDGKPRSITQDDVKGAGEIVDLAHNVLAVSRDYALEERINEALDENSAPRIEELSAKPSGLVRQLKDRIGGQYGTSRLHFDSESGQFSDEWRKYRKYLSGNEVRVDWREKEKCIRKKRLTTSEQSVTSQGKG